MRIFIERRLSNFESFIEAKDKLKEICQDHRLLNLTNESFEAHSQNIVDKFGSDSSEMKRFDIMRYYVAHKKLRYGDQHTI